MNIYHIIDSNTNERATCLSFDTTDDAQRYLDVMSTWESSKGVSLEIAPTEVPSMTVGELIENYDCDASGDIDVYDDYDESLGVAFCGGYILTDEGREHFKDALDINLEMGESGHYAIAHVNYFIDPDIDPDVDPDDPKFALLKQLFYGIAGFCADSDFKRWFTEKQSDPDEPNKPEHFLVVITDESGESPRLMTAYEILNWLDMWDCYPECGIAVWRVSGDETTRLNLYGAWHNPDEPLYMKGCLPDGTVVFDGYGTDH